MARYPAKTPPWSQKQFDDRGAVEEPVEDGGGHDPVGEHGAPVAEAAVGRQHDRAALIAPGYDLEDPVGAGSVHRQVAELVDDEDRGSRIRPHLGAPAALEVGRLE